jgi:hypothetical protein
VTVKGPYPVQEIIGRSGKRKTDGIGYILLYFQYFLEEIGGPEIDEDTRKSNQAELDKFEKENLVNEFV